MRCALAAATDHELRLCAAAIGLYETNLQNPGAPGLQCEIDEKALNHTLETLAEDGDRYISMVETIFMAREKGWTIVSPDYIRQHPELLEEHPELREELGL